MNVPFHIPYYDSSDERALVVALRSGKLVGDGENTRRASGKLQQLLGVKHALLTPSKEKPLGTIGDMGCFSFHETKNLSTGEGGALVTNTEAFATRGEILREKGTNRKQFMMGLVDKYTWVDVGSSYLPPDTVGAMLLSQLDKLDAVRRLRAVIHERYMLAFSSLAAEGLLVLPVIPAYMQSNHHIFFVLVQDEATRNDAISFFRSRGTGTAFHYLPLHLSPVGRGMGYQPGDFPVTESVSARLLRLPIYPSLKEEEQEYVIATMKEFLHR